MREPGLTKRDKNRLAKCEERIAKGMHGFVDAGLALAEVNEHNLFITYGSFAAYCKQRWEITPTYARNLIRAASVVQHLRGEECETIVSLPLKETHARPLTTIPMEKVSGVWQMVVDSAPKTDAGEPRITADLVKQKVEEWKTASGQRSGGAAQKPDLGKCPNCASTKWTEDEDGITCAKCYHPHGEPAGDPDEDRIKTQRQKTVKTAEALMRAFDDLQAMKARGEHGGSAKWTADDALATVKDMGVIQACKGLLKLARGWK